MTQQAQAVFKSGVTIYGFSYAIQDKMPHFVALSSTVQSLRLEIYGINNVFGDFSLD